MTIALCVALVIITIYLVLRYFRIKNDSKDKDSLTEAYLKKDYDQYLAILNYKIGRAADVKDKNILATLKIQAYLPQRDWAKAQALYEQVNTKKLPKKIKLTFLCHYITMLYLSGQTDKAQAFVQTNQKFLEEGQGNSGYSLYLDSFQALQAFADQEYGKAQELFRELQDHPQANDFYREIFAEYLAQSQSLQAPD